jgi:hypothetical protein
MASSAGLRCRHVHVIPSLFVEGGGGGHRRRHVRPSSSFEGGAGGLHRHRLRHSSSFEKGKAASPGASSRRSRRPRLLSLALHVVVAHRPPVRRPRRNPPPGDLSPAPSRPRLSDATTAAVVVVVVVVVVPRRIPSRSSLRPRDHRPHPPSPAPRVFRPPPPHYRFIAPPPVAPSPLLNLIVVYSSRQPSLCPIRLAEAEASSAMASPPSPPSRARRVPRAHHAENKKGFFL